MMDPIMTTLVQQEQHRDRLKELEQDRLARIASLSQPGLEKLLSLSPPGSASRWLPGD